ncbi:MAG: hypothetical protein ACYTEZ_19020 [Planctomycetota bacterium]
MTTEEARAVDEAVARDPVLCSALEDLKSLGELFGEVEPEEVSGALKERLYALGTVQPLARFEAVRTAPVRRVSWTNWAAAAAAVLMVVVGIRALSHQPEVVLKDFTRMAVDADGRALDTRLLNQVTVRSGDTLRAGAGERLSFRTLEGDVVVLLPGGALEVGDPRDGKIFELHAGTVLCTVLTRQEPRTVLAGGYAVHVQREAHFGIRVQGAELKTAGPSVGRGARVTVAVSLGSVEVARNGDRRQVKAFERVTLRRGEPAQATHAAMDPIYHLLMRSFRRNSWEICPGYFSGERGVTSVPRWRWSREGAARVLTLSDGGREAAQARYLVLHVRASRPGPLRLTRVRPFTDRPGVAEAVTVPTPPVGTDWTVIAVPRDAFGAPTAARQERKISRGRSRLVRLELGPQEPDIEIELKASLWAHRPPTEVPEVVR